MQALDLESRTSHEALNMEDTTSRTEGSQVSLVTSKASIASNRSRPSFFKPAGNKTDAPPPKEVGPLAEIVFFMIFVATRTLHAPINDALKTMSVKYLKFAPIVVESVFTLILGQLLALSLGGKQQWKQIWRMDALKVFSMIGFVYALGDIFEVISMGRLSGDMYNVLLQSKLLITALMMGILKGTRQSRLQWILITLVMLSCCVYSVAGKPSKPKTEAAKLAEEAKGGLDVFLDWGFVVIKVVISCFCAVLSDKYMKEFKDIPIYSQLVLFKVAWVVTAFLACIYEAINEGVKPWSGFDDYKIWNASLSFIAKGWASFYLLAVLDSLLKNIGEAASVLTSYLLYLTPVVTAVGVKVQKEFNVQSFLMVLVVTVAVMAYVEAKGVVEKARRFEKEHPEDA